MLIYCFLSFISVADAQITLERQQEPERPFLIDVNEDWEPIGEDVIEIVEDGQAAVSGTGLSCDGLDESSSQDVESFAPELIGRLEDGRALIKGHAGTEIPVSVLTLDELQAAHCRLFAEQEQHTHNPVICRHRAYMNAYHLENEQGLSVARVHAQADLPFWRHMLGRNHFHPDLSLVDGLDVRHRVPRAEGWGYHQSNIIFVEKRDPGSGEKKLEPYVIDPFLAPNRPMPLTEWHAILSSGSNDPEIATRFEPAGYYSSRNNHRDSGFHPEDLNHARVFMELPPVDQRRDGELVLPTELFNRVDHLLVRDELAEIYNKDESYGRVFPNRRPDTCSQVTD